MRLPAVSFPRSIRAWGQWRDSRSREMSLVPEGPIRHRARRAPTWPRNVARAQAVSPQVESCNVYLPHPAIAPWVESFIDECSSFPNGKYDDQVDQMTQVLNWLRGAVAPIKKPVYRPPPPPSGPRSWMR